jgi:hypothetical protein
LHATGLSETAQQVEAVMPDESLTWTKDEECVAKFCGMEKEVEWWTPFSDVACDYDVLERARKVWGEGSRERADFREWLAEVADHYVVGDWSRAALAVLREMEERTNG